MNILFVSTSYPMDSFDWKGIFIKNILSSLSSLKKNLNVSYFGPYGEMPQEVTYRCSASEKLWFDKLLNAGGIAHVLKASPLKGLIYALSLLYKLRRVFNKSGSEIDVYHVNWLQNIMSFPLKDKTLVVPVLGSDIQLIKYPFVKFFLKRCMRANRVVLTPNSYWMESVLNKEFGDLCEVKTVSFGIDEQYYSIERKLSDSKRWIAVFRVTDEKIGELFDWGSEVFDSELELHLIGPNQGGLDIPDWVKFHGSKSQKDLIEEWFPTSLGIISLSHHSEGKPQVLLEAMAAGLPIICSDLPAHRDTIDSNKEGTVVNSKEEFINAIKLLSDDIKVNLEYSENARKRVLEEYGTWKDCAQRYYSIYTSDRGTFL